MLNQGILRTAVADSDTHERVTNGGAVRTWVASDVTAPIDLPAHADALAASVVAGHAIGTNSLFFTPRATADSTGQTAGLGTTDPTLIATNDGTVKLDVAIRAPLWAEFDRVEVYVNNAPQRWDHDSNPATRLRYRVIADRTLDAGTDFTIATVDDDPSVPDAKHREATVTTCAARRASRGRSSPCCRACRARATRRSPIWSTATSARAVRPSSRSRIRSTSTSTAAGGRRRACI